MINLNMCNLCQDTNYWMEGPEVNQPQPYVMCKHFEKHNKTWIETNIWRGPQTK